MTVKCDIPARIKQCADCEYYQQPYKLTTSEGDVVYSLPQCLVQMDLINQKSPCPSYKHWIPHIYQEGRAE